MMIHEYHKIVGKTKTRQELRLKNQNRVGLYIFTSPWILLKFLCINHNFPIFPDSQSVTTVVQLENLEVS